MSGATREIFANVPPEQQILFYLLALGSIATFVWGLWIRVRRWRRGRGKPALGPKAIVDRLPGFFRDVFGQPKVRRSSGWMHLAIFWGFLVLFVGTELVALEHDTPLSFFHGLFYLLFSLAMDVFGAILLIGVAVAAWRRYVIRPERIRAEGWALPLAMLGTLAVTGFVLEGLRMALYGSFWFDWSPGGALVAILLSGVDRGALGSVHRAVWWLHAAVTFVFVAYLPFGRLRHAIAAPLNLFFSSGRSSGVLSIPFRLEALEAGATDRPVPETVADLGWKQLLSLDACTECGLCQQACPAWAAERPLSPKRVVVELRDHLDQGGEAAWQTPLERVVSPLEAWSCTTCGACQETCPVGVEHVDLLVDVRRALTMKSRLEPGMSAALEKLERFGNPFGLPPEQRVAWLAGLPLSARIEVADPKDPPEWLYWVGCVGAFEERGQRVARAVATLLRRAGVKVAVLGVEERCTGDPARRLGEEGLFQRLARENVATLARYGVRKIVTGCAHCFHTLKNEYPAFGGRYEVRHHTELLADLVAEGRLAPGEAASEEIVTFHDPCYLARHNDLVAPARRTLSSLPGRRLVEMPRSGARSFCCGAGGSNLWFELGVGRKINGIRYDEAQATGARTIVTACPFCTTMFEEIASSRSETGPRIRDLAEILEEATS
jgi:Fe-S oxidoreductase/nitrate reductase gamma subunit